jgi:hypothetical protein
MVLWWYDPDAASREECRYVREFRQMATDSILAHLNNATTTPEQYQVALECLLALKDELTGRIDDFHRSALYGRHRCLDQAYHSLRRQLLNALLLRPVPQPAAEPEPAPSQPLLTPEDVVAAVGDPVQPSADETYLGTADEPPDTERPP